MLPLGRLIDVTLASLITYIRHITDLMHRFDNVLIFPVYAMTNRMSLISWTSSRKDYQCGQTIPETQRFQSYSFAIH